MTPFSILLILVSALIHSSWNFITNPSLILQLPSKFWGMDVHLHLSLSSPQKRNLFWESLAGLEERNSRHYNPPECSLPFGSHGHAVEQGELCGRLPASGCSFRCIDGNYFSKGKSLEDPYNRSPHSNPGFSSNWIGKVVILY